MRRAAANVLETRHRYRGEKLVVELVDPAMQCEDPCVKVLGLFVADGPSRARTGDLRAASATLSQLSYGPVGRRL
jgi:hypothetical protein